MKAPKREAKRWLLQAEDDLQFVEWIQKEGLFCDKGCFMSQQAGEKALKACLYGLGRRHVLGHSLFEMVADLSKRDDDFVTIVNPARRLDRFYVAARYPNGLPGGSPFQVYSTDDLAEAYKDVKKVCQLCRKFLQKLKVL
jgi:HEPN domain-containing protein